MKLFSPFEVIPADQATPGSIVVLNHEGLLIAALTVRIPEQGEGGMGFLMLEPTAPEYDGRAGIFYAHVFGQSPALKVLDAQAVVPSRLSAAAAPSAHVRPGALIIGEGGRLVVAGSAGQGVIRHYALDDGEALRAKRGIWFAEWEIVVPDSNGKTQTFCTVRSSAN